MSTFETIDITQIDVNPDVYPRVGPDEEIVETYRLRMEDGVKFPPLVVQKETHTLIDGRHRLEAYKKLGKEKVEVEILDIPINELRAESIRRNIKHGKRLTRREIVKNILDLRFKDKKSEKVIAEIVGLSEGRISQICKEHRNMPRYLPELSNFNSKDTKIDLRAKVDEEEILEDLKSGMQEKKIAKKHGISQPRVSQIKKEYEEWVSSPVYIKMKTHRAHQMFNYAFANKLLKKARIEFKEKGVFIRNSNDKKPPLVIAEFPDHYFTEYRVHKPIEGYAESDILLEFKKIEQEQFELALMDETTWKIRWERKVSTQEYKNLDWREFPLPHVELDADGIPTKCTVKGKTFAYAFPRNEKGKMTLRAEKENIKCYFECIHGWKCDQPLKFKSEKEDNAIAYVDLKMLDEILKTFKGDVRLGMWSNKNNLAIGQAYKDWKICYII